MDFKDAKSCIRYLKLRKWGEVFPPLPPPHIYFAGWFKGPYSLAQLQQKVTHAYIIK